MRKRYFIFAMLFCGICAFYVSAEDSEIPATALSEQEKIEILQAKILVSAEDSEIPVTALSEQEKIEILQAKILKNVQKQVDLLKENLVNIISREELSNEVVTLSKKVEITEYRVSLISEPTSAIPDCGVVAKLLNPLEPPYLLQEKRSLLFVERKRGAGSFFPQLIEGTVRNGFVELIVPFDKQYEKCFDYKLLGAAKINGRNAYVISVLGREISKEEEIIKITRKTVGDKFVDEKNGVTMRERRLIKEGGIIGEDIIDEEEKPIVDIVNYPTKFGDDGVPITEPVSRTYKDQNTEMAWEINFGGYALIDAETMDIFQFNKGRIDVNLTGITDSEGYFYVQTEYEKIKIKDQFFTLPVTRKYHHFVRGKTQVERGRLPITLGTFEYTDTAHLLFRAECTYSDYRLFDVNTQITYGTPEESPDQKPLETDESYKAVE